MDPTNKKIEDFKVTRFTMPGPGQIPKIPQPIPNKAEPSISFESISCFVGKKCSFEQRGVRVIRKRKAKKLKPTAPAITRAREKSQFPKRSRKPMTFSGLIMPETTRPIAKIIPENKLIKRDNIKLAP